MFYSYLVNRFPFQIFTFKYSYIFKTWVQFVILKILLKMVFIRKIYFEDTYKSFLWVIYAVWWKIASSDVLFKFVFFTYFNIVSSHNPQVNMELRSDKFLESFWAKTFLTLHIFSLVSMIRWQRILFTCPTMKILLLPPRKK